MSHHSNYWNKMRFMRVLNRTVLCYIHNRKEHYCEKISSFTVCRYRLIVYDGMFEATRTGRICSSQSLGPPSTGQIYKVHRPSGASSSFPTKKEPWRYSPRFLRSHRVFWLFLSEREIPDSCWWESSSEVAMTFEISEDGSASFSLTSPAPPCQSGDCCEIFKHKNQF